jgi:hypothetical protein
MTFIESKKSMRQRHKKALYLLYDLEAFTCNFEVQTNKKITGQPDFEKNKRLYTAALIAALLNFHSVLQIFDGESVYLSVQLVDGCSIET